MPARLLASALDGESVSTSGASSRGGAPVELTCEVEGHHVGQRLHVAPHDPLHPEVDGESADDHQQRDGDGEEDRDGTPLVSTAAAGQLTLAVEVKVRSSGSGTSGILGVSGFEP